MTKVCDLEHRLMIAPIEVLEALKLQTLQDYFQIKLVRANDPTLKLLSNTYYYIQEIEEIRSEE